MSLIDAILLQKIISESKKDPIDNLAIKIDEIKIFILDLINKESNILKYGEANKLDIKKAFKYIDGILQNKPYKTSVFDKVLIEKDRYKKFDDKKIKQIISYYSKESLDNLKIYSKREYYSRNDPSKLIYTYEEQNPLLIHLVKTSNIFLARHVIKSESGIDIDVTGKNDYNRTSLHLAVRMKDEDMTQLLLKNGADANKKDDYEESASQAMRGDRTFSSSELSSIDFTISSQNTPSGKKLSRIAEVKKLIAGVLINYR